MASNTRKSKSKKRQVPRSHWRDYLLILSAAFFLVLILGFIYVEDVREGLGILAEIVVEYFFSEMF
jgi:Trk-type K+ transport system membrane component